MNKKFISFVYVIVTLLFVTGVLMKFIPVEGINPDLLICISILAPRVFDYRSVVDRGMMEMRLNFFILVSGFVVLYDFYIGLFLFLIFQSVLYAKQGGVILRKFTSKGLS